MKVWKRFNVKGIVAVFLIIALALTACSGGGKQANQPNDDGGDKKQAEKVQEKQERAKITILTDDGLNSYAKVAKLDDQYSKEISRLFGHDVFFEWLDSGSQSMTVRFASGEIPDIIQTSGIQSHVHPNALENGVFLELNDLLDEYGQNIKKKIPEDLWDNERVSKDGIIYGVPVMDALLARKVVFIRQDWLDQLNMKHPVTLDDYLAYFDAVKTTDLNGSGSPDDQIPYMVHENMGPFNTLFFSYFGVQPHAWNVVDGKVMPDIIDPRMKEAIAFWKMLYDKEYINQDLFTKKMNDKVNDIHSDKVGMWMHDVQNINDWWSTSAFINPDQVKLDVLPGPADEHGETRLMPNSAGFSGVKVINAKTKHAKEAIQFLDWSLSDDPEKDRFFAFGIEGHNYTIADGQVQYDPDAPENEEKAQSSYYQVLLYPLGDNRMAPELMELSNDKELLKKAVEIAEQGAYDTIDKHMASLEAMIENPELGARAGSLFLDMFAKVVTGKEELDPAFDNFVNEWKRRGGDEAIQQANEWYKSTQ